MAIEITVPRLGWSMDKGTFVEWLKNDGDEVKEGDVIFALESDKAVQEIESIDGGILRIPPNGPRKDDEVKIGQVLGYLVVPGEDTPAYAGTSPTPAGKKQKAVSHPTEGAKTATEQKTTPVSSAPAEPLPPSGRPLSAPMVSPRAARLAIEKGVDLRAVRGTGRNGRITEKDVAAAGRGATASVPVQPRPTSGLDRTIQPTAMRRTIAERMMKSRSATVPVTLTTQADASALVSFRNQLKTAWPGDSVPTYNDLFIKFSALALLKHPGLNASWESEQIVLNGAVNIGIAVDTDSGLLVPVLRDVPAIGLRELAARTRELIERARQRRLSADELSGGTFTVSNLGALGVDAFTPVINHPECAVLGVGRITLQPAVNESGSIVPRQMVWLSLTFDHRVTDGAPAARFLNTIRKYVENPDERLMK